MTTHATRSPFDSRASSHGVVPRTLTATLLLAAIASADVRAQSAPWMIGPFTKPSAVNPILSPSAAATFRSPMNDSLVQWEAFATFNPAAVVRDGKVFVLYRAEDATGASIIGGHTSRIGLAESRDGVHFTRHPAPILFPANDGQKGNEWPGGVEDPRIVEDESGRYVLTYTQWNRQVPRLAVATSRDLVRWEKHGPAFADAAGGKYLGVETKSGAILSRVVGDRIVATKVDGKYWMYFNVPDVLIATSDDLVHWTPVEDANGRALKVLAPRPGYFDSWLVEAGPPPLLTERGIVMLYNAGNSQAYGDRALPERMYTAGQALFDARNPLKLLARTDVPFIRPTEPYEKSGQYAEGTTFVEALIPFKGQWFLYYGTADSRVGVAVAPMRRPARSR
ncbi:MAG: pesticidal protein Cry15Aa [Gemmatimonadetes bacterium]|nr:pesticidal protein Cry15Aa [Gemmatimonadota bacterium]